MTEKYGLKQRDFSLFFNNYPKNILMFKALSRPTMTTILLCGVLYSMQLISYLIYVLFVTAYSVSLPPPQVAITSTVQCYATHTATPTATTATSTVATTSSNGE